MKLSKSYWQTYKEVPSDAEVASHRLLLRAGFIHKTSGGIYTYLPMAQKVISKIKKIIREELNSIGGQEILMSFVTPGELWKKSKRWDSMGPEMVRLQDRKGGDFCLSATNEETITDLFGSTINSYKQLPVNLYQINTKFRDEIRPRFGLLRGREFIMKDAYTFHADKTSMDEVYQDHYKAYENIFTSMGLDFIVVEADGGAMADAGSQTHEFQVIADSGEDAVVEVKETGYAANIETAETFRPALKSQPSSEIKEFETKNLPTCEAVAELLNIPVHQTLKSLVFTASYGEKSVHYMIMLLGDDSLNEVKLKNFLKADHIKAASADILKELSLIKGYMSPLNVSGFSVLVDEAVDVDAGYIVGANKEDFHVSGFTVSRDLEKFKKGNFREAQNSDLGPDKLTPIKIRRGIEVGHIFQLGNKYTKSMGASVLDQNGKKINPLMGCYGIGVSRTMAAAVEQCHDENGIIWPAPIAPFDAYFAVIGKKEETKSLAEDIYTELKKAKIDILFDDRGMGPGAMFKDSDLLGLPLRIVLGERDYAESGELEIKIRKSGESVKVRRENLVAELKSHLKVLGKDI